METFVHLIEDFEYPTSYEDLLDDINRRKQRSNQPHFIFFEIYIMMNKLRRPLTESEKLRIIVRNVLPQYAFIRDSEGM